MHKFNRWHEVVLIVSALLLSILGTLPATAQQVQLPRAASPITLLGFEMPDAAGKWTGLKTEVTTMHVSEGNSALAIVIPQWDGRSFVSDGKGDRSISATLAWDNGKGYAVEDWSHYGKITFDAWIEGDKPLDIQIEFQSDTKKYGAARDFVVMPGKKNSFELVLQDVAEVIDTSNVQAITIYGLYPKQDTKLTIDNVQLLPGDKLPLAVFDLVYPNYREMIMPGVSNIKTTLELHPGEYNVDPTNLSLTLTAIGGSVKATNTVGIKGDLTAITVPTANLPRGSVKLSASLKDSKSGKVLASQNWSLRKLSKADRDALKVYIDENNNTIVDGKPFFLLGWYLRPSIDQLAEIAGSPFNTILPYGVNARSKAFMNNYLDLVQGYGMKIIYGLQDVHPAATDYDGIGWEGITGNNNIADAVIDAYKNHPAILAWYLNDERPKELAPLFEQYYQRVRKDDPTHPCYTVIYAMPEVKYFAATTDIMGEDRYPVPMEPITTVAKEMRNSESAVKGHKPTWAVIQAFAWYQYDPAFPDRGRIPTQDDLRNGRAPSYDESRCMTYQALVHGAKGLIYYSYYDMRVLPQYAEMWAGMKKIGAEVKALSPILLSQGDMGSVSCAPEDSGVDTKLKELDEQLYLIAVNTRNTPCRITFDIRQAVGNKIPVMFEGRFVMNSKDTYLADTFKPLEAHVYDLGRVVK